MYLSAYSVKILLTGVCNKLLIYSPYGLWPLDYSIIIVIMNIIVIAISIPSVDFLMLTTAFSSFSRRVQMPLCEQIYEDEPS